MTDLSGVDPNVNPDPANYIINQRRAAQGAMVGALDANPDEAARALQLSEATGAHPALVDANLEEFEQQHKAALTSHILNNNPYLRDYVNSHPLAAKVSNDDFGQLDAVSHSVKSIPKANDSFLKDGINQLVLQAAMANPVAAPAIIGTSAGIKALPQTWESIKEGLSQIVSGPKALIGVDTDKKIAEDSEKWLLSQGVPADIAKREAKILQSRVDRNTAWQGPLFGVMQILNSPAIGPFREFITKPLETKTGFPAEATEGLTFAALGFLGLRGMKAKPVPEVRRAVTAADPFVRAGQEPPVGIDPLIDELHAKRTEVDLEQLDAALKESQRSATRERNPEMFARFIRSHTDARIAVSAEAIRKLYGEKQPAPDDGILGWAPDIADQLRIAEAGGGDVHIPLAEWLAKVDPGVAKELHDDIRVRGNGLTLREAGELEKPKAEPALEEGGLASQLQESISKLTDQINAAVDAGDQAKAKELLALQDELARELKTAQRLKKEPVGEPVAARPEGKTQRSSARLTPAERKEFERGVGDDLLDEVPSAKLTEAGLEWDPEHSGQLLNWIDRQRSLAQGERLPPSFYNSSIFSKRMRGVPDEFRIESMEDSLRRSGGLEPLADRLDPEAARLAKLEEEKGLTGGRWVDVGQSSKIYVKPGEKYTAYEKQIHDAVNEILARVAPKNVEVGGGHALALRGEEVHGLYQEYAKNDPVILWSLQAERPTGVARHEAIHALFRGGFFTDAEWALLKKTATEEEWIRRYDVDKRYKGDSLELHLEEAIAERYAEWGRNKEHAGDVHPIFEKMKKLILELRDKIKDIIGEEPTAEKLFEMVEAGVIRDREGAVPRDPEAFRGPAAQKFIEEYKPNEEYDPNEIIANLQEVIGSFSTQDMVLRKKQVEALDKQFPDFGVKSMALEDLEQRLKGNALKPLAQRPEQPELPGVTRLEDREVYGRKVFEGLPKKYLDKWMELIAKRDAEDTEYGAKKAEKEVAKRQTAEWKAESSRIREELRPDLVARPDLAADEFLREGRLHGEKIRGRPRLDAEALTTEQKAALPEDYYAKGGLHPDDVAGLFGYQTGTELVERVSALVKDRGEAGPREYVNRLLEAQVERRMQAEHGDLATNILEEAQDHVVSGTQMDILHQEVLGLGMRAGVLDPDAGITITQADMRRWVKAEFDKQTISSHSVQKYLRDAGRAANKAINALVTDDLKEAFKFKQQQQISFMMANEAKALEKAQKSFERNAKLMSRREVPSVQQDYTNFIHDILGRVGKPVRRSVQDLAETIARGEWPTLEAFVNAKQADLREVPVADFLLDPNFRKEFGSLTAEEFRAVHDSVKALLKNGRDEKKIYKAGEAADLEVVKGELVAELGQFPKEPRIPDTKLGKFRRIARTYIAAHLQLESLFNRWDRGNPQGPWTQYVMRDLASAANFESTLERKYARMLKELGDKTNLDERVNNKIFYDPFSFERDPETGRMGPGANSELLPFTRKNLRAVLQNAGNRSNLEKLAAGYGLTPDLVMAWLHKNATKADWDWAQKQGDIFKEIKRESDQMYRNLTDIEPESVPIEPIDTPHGRYEGWYHPVVYDPVWEGMSKKLMGGDALEGDNYVRATTPAGYTKARTGYVAPMSLFLDQTPIRMKQMLHDIAFRPAVINAGKVFYDKDVRTAIAKHYGPEYRDLLVPWLKDVANSSNSRSDVQAVGARVSEFFRQNIIATLIGLNPGTVMKHGPTAAMNSITEVGPANFAKAVAGLLSKDEVTGETNWRFAMNNSEELARRHRHYVETLKGASEGFEAEKGFVGTLKEIGTSSVALTKGDILPMRQTMIKLGAHPVAWSDLLSAVPTWLAKYETSIREGADHGTAVFDADRAVRRAHGSSVITNRPAVMRGGPMAQWMSSLYGFFSHILNRQFEMAWKAKDTLGLAKEGEYAAAASRLPELGVMFFSYVVFPAVVEELASGQLDDKHEGWGTKAAKALAHSLSGSWIGIRDIVNAFAYGRDPSAGLMGEAFKTVTNTARDLKKDQPMSKQHAGTFIQHFITMIGGLTGLTNAQEGRTAKFIYNYSTGQERPKGWHGWYRGIRFGTTKEHK